VLTFLYSTQITLLATSAFIYILVYYCFARIIHCMSYSLECLIFSSFIRDTRSVCKCFGFQKGIYGRSVQERLNFEFILYISSQTFPAWTLPDTKLMRCGTFSHNILNKPFHFSVFNNNLWKCVIVQYFPFIHWRELDLVAHWAFNVNTMKHDKQGLVFNKSCVGESVWCIDLFSKSVIEGSQSKTPFMSYFINLTSRNRPGRNYKIIQIGYTHIV